MMAFKFPLPSTVEDLIFGSVREIAGIIPDVTISERHTDELTITDHPVERGSNIADHAYKRPEEVVVTFGWNDSANLINSLLNGSIFSGANSARDVYDRLIKIQEACELVKLTTGKRSYEDMLIQSLKVTTDANTEHALIVEATLRRVNIVDTEKRAAADEQQNPEDTGGCSYGGQRSATLVTEGRVL